MSLPLQILEFTFQSFWHWLGTVILFGAMFGGVASIFRAVFVRATWETWSPKLKATIRDAVREARTDV